MTPQSLYRNKKRSLNCIINFEKNEQNLPWNVWQQCVFCNTTIATALGQYFGNCAWLSESWVLQFSEPAIKTVLLIDGYT